jgi:MvdC family ATP-grasp ribosomal peptide maturase
MARDTVLLLTHSGDFFTVERVAAALARRGARPFRLDTDLFPAEVRLSARLSPRGSAHTVTAGGERVGAAEVRAVWARKLWPARLDERLGAEFRALCGRESAAALAGFLDGLAGARWVNPPALDLRAEDKLLQLRLAREAGLDTPHTLLTNDPAEARAFFVETGGRMVAKLLRPLSVSMGAAPLFVYTSDVTEADLAEAEQLRHCPSVFQERVEKERELRAAYVGGRLFVGALDARGSARGATDWRRADPAECRWEHDALPADVAARLDSLMRRLGLLYGALDIIRTPDGRHVLLEVNPGGEWGMLERDLGLPISEALAEELLKE